MENCFILRMDIFLFCSKLTFRVFFFFLTKWNGNEALFLCEQRQMCECVLVNKSQFLNAQGQQNRTTFFFY